MPSMNAMGQLAPGLLAQHYGQPPLKPQRMPSVMGRSGQWVPPDHPDAMHDPMQAMPQQGTPMGIQGTPGPGWQPQAPVAPMPPPQPPSGGADSGTLGNLYQQMQAAGQPLPSTPPPPQGDDWRARLAARGGGFSGGLRHTLGNLVRY